MDSRFPKDLNTIISLLESHLWNVGNEAELQKSMGDLFTREKIQHVREFRPDKKSRFDFYVPQEKGCIEVKITSDFKKTIRQVQRYALLDCVDYLIVVTTRRNKSGLYPNKINGKPLHTIVLRSPL